MSTPNSVSDKPHYEHKEGAAYDGELGEPVHDKAFERVMVKKIDRRLLIILGALYAVSLIDRTNISVARVAGMQVELNLGINERYSIISAIFFAPYVVFELPSNVLLRKFGCRNHLTFIVIAWGAVMTGMAFVKTWEQLAACRVLLGVLEAGFFPGCVFLISCWYTRFETQKRMAFFYLTSMVIAGFSQIISYAFSLLSGRAGLTGWRWIFLLFGIITIALGIVAGFTIVDFPDKATFLNPEQKALSMQRIEDDRGDSTPDELTWGKAFKHFGDFKLWLFALCFMCTTSATYGFAYFLPVILSGAGYSTRDSMLLAAPPYVVAAIYTFGMAYLSDRMRKRGLFIIINSLVCTTGLLIMAYAKPTNVRYFGSFVALAGCQCNIPSVLTYQANNILTHSKRAVASALVIGFGGIGGIFSSFVFRQKDFPYYRPGLWATIACQLFIIASVLGLSVWFRYKNKKADRDGTANEGNVNFRYTL